MKLAFAGTPEFARIALAALLDAGHHVGLVLTQPDRPAGRGLRPQPSPVKTLALHRGLAVLQPRSLRLDGRWPEDAQTARTALAAAAPQVLVVAAYGLMLPAWTLALPPLGCINIHASLLPRWRGAAPIQRAIEAGDTETGVCIMRMEEGLDTGPVLLRAIEPILPDDTGGSLHDRLATLGAATLLRALDRLACGDGMAEPQSDQGVCYAHKIGRGEGRLDWTQAAEVLARRLRAFAPVPGCHTALGDLLLKLGRFELCSSERLEDKTPGEIVSADAGGVVVACGSGALRLLQLQRPGGRMLEAAEFLRGLPLAPGQRLH